MRHVIIAFVGLFIGISASQLIIHANAKEAPKKDDKNDIVCLTNAELDKIMVDKNYDVLLTMKNNDNIVESVWVYGQSIIITAAIPNEQKSCLLATMSDVTFNPKAIEEIWETYKKQTKQKDI